MAKIKFTQLETLTTQSVNLSALMPVVQDGENYNIALSSLPSSGGGSGNTSTECVSSRCLKNTISEDPNDVRGFALDRIWDQPVFKGEGSIITFDDVVDTDVQLVKVQLTIEFIGTGHPSGETPNYYYDVTWTPGYSSSSFEFGGEEEDVLVLELNPENEFTLE